MLSTGCKATTIGLLNRFFYGTRKILGNLWKTADLQTEPCMVLKFWEISNTSALDFLFTETLSSKCPKKSLQVYKKRTTPWIFYWEVSKNFWSSYFCNMKMDRYFWKKHRKNVMNNKQKYGVIQKVGHLCATHSKNNNFASGLLCEWPLWCWPILPYFYEWSK